MSFSRMLGTISILSSWAIATYPVAANPTQIVDFAPNSHTLQSTQSKQINFTLHITRTQSFAELMQQAELTATKLTQQGFTENSRLHEMSVRIFGERNGQEAPLLFTKVSRFDWQKQPRIQNWSQYFTSSAILLGLLGTEKQPSSPSTSTTPTFRSPNPSISAPPVPIPPPPKVQPSSGNTPPPPGNLPGNSRPGGASLEEGDPGYR
jgi:hypothetical protein